MGGLQLVDMSLVFPAHAIPTFGVQLSGGLHVGLGIRAKPMKDLVKRKKGRKEREMEGERKIMWILLL